MRPNQPFDAVEAACQAFGQKMVPVTARVIGAITEDEAGTNARAEFLVVVRLRAQHALEPGVEATARGPRARRIISAPPRRV